MLDLLQVLLFALTDLAWMRWGLPRLGVAT